MANRRRKTLVCPKCGWDANREGKNDFCFRFIEEVVIIKRIDGISRSGRLEVAAEEDSNPDDLADDARIRCGDCEHEFPMPKDLQIEWV